MSAMKTLSGSMKKLPIKTKRGDRQHPITLQFHIIQACLEGWTLDKFQLFVQGINEFQFVVGNFGTKQQSVSSSGGSGSGSGSRNVEAKMKKTLKT